MATRAHQPALVLLTAALWAVLLALAGPVWAHHKDGHGKGGNGKNSSSQVTEDNDDDGYPNAFDPEGDADNEHPSDKDRHEEPGSSGNQGNAQSDPDGMANGGEDKPGGTGGGGPARSGRQQRLRQRRRLRGRQQRQLRWQG